MWECPECDEQLEPTFHACWNCGKVRLESGDPDFAQPEQSVQAGANDITAAPAENPSPKLRTLMLGLAVCGVLTMACWLLFGRLTTAEEFYHRGYIHLAKGNLATGFSDLNKAIELAHQERAAGELTQLELAHYYHLRAAAHSHQENHAQAIHDLTIAIDLMAPAFPRKKFDLVSHHKLSGSPLNTFSDWDAWLDMHKLRANELLHLKENQPALDDLRFVLKHQPESKTANHLMAVAEGEVPLSE